MVNFLKMLIEADTGRFDSGVFMCICGELTPNFQGGSGRTLEPFPNCDFRLIRAAPNSIVPKAFLFLSTTIDCARNTATLTGSKSGRALLNYSFSYSPHTKIHHLLHNLNFLSTF